MYIGSACADGDRPVLSQSSWIQPLQLHGIINRLCVYPTY